MSGLAQVEVCPHAHTRPRTRISYRLANRAAPVCNGLCGDRPLLRGGNPINQKGLLQTQGKEGRRPAEASLVSSSPAAPQGLPRVTPWFLDRHTISSFLRRSHRQAKHRPRLRTGLYLGPRLQPASGHVTHGPWEESTELPPSWSPSEGADRPHSWSAGAQRIRFYPTV